MPSSRADLLDVDIGHAHEARIVQRRVRRAYLRKHRPDIRANQVDDIANLAFIGGSTNQSISAKAPSDYLAKLAEEKPKLLEAQQIPLDPELFNPDRYLNFLEARRALISDRLTEFLVSPA